MQADHIFHDADYRRNLDRDDAADQGLRTQPFRLGEVMSCSTEDRTVFDAGLKVKMKDDDHASRRTDIWKIAVDRLDRKIRIL